MGIRLSPFNPFLDVSDSNPIATNEYLMQQLNPLGLAYVHMVEPRMAGNEALPDDQVKESVQPLRTACKAPFIAAGGFSRESGAQAVASGHADLIAYGRWVLRRCGFGGRRCNGGAGNHVSVSSAAWACAPHNLHSSNSWIAQPCMLMVAAALTPSLCYAFALCSSPSPRPYLANPDMPKRFLLNAPLNAYNRDTFYSQVRGQGGGGGQPSASGCCPPTQLEFAVLQRHDRGWAPGLPGDGWEWLQPPQSTNCCALH